MSEAGAGKSKVEYVMKISMGEVRLQQLWMGAAMAAQQGHHEQAIASYEQFVQAQQEQLDLVIEHNDKHPDPMDLVSTAGHFCNVLQMYASSLETLGRWEEGAAQRDRALALAEQHLDEAAVATLLRSRVPSLVANSRFHEALPILTRLTATIDPAEDVEAMASSMLALVDIYHWLGDSPRAMALLEQVEEVISPRLEEGSPGFTDILAGVLDAANGRVSPQQPKIDMQLFRISNELRFYKGLILLSLNRPREAREHFEAVLPSYRLLGAGEGIEIKLAQADMKDGQPERALALLERLEGAFETNPKLRAKLPVLMRRKAQALLVLGRGEEAAPLLKMALKDLEQNGLDDPDQRWRLLSEIGQAQQQRGDDAAAFCSYSEAAEVVHQLRRVPLGYRLDSAYLADKVELFERAILLACVNGDAGRCVQLVEMIKSRTLAATLSVPGDGGAKGDAELERQLEQVTRALDAIAYRSRSAEAGVGPDPGELRQEVERLKARRRDLLEQLRLEDPRWRTMTAPVSLDLLAVQSSLAEGEAAALNLFRLEDRVVSVLVTGGGCKVDAVQLCPRTRQALARYAANLRQRRPSAKLFSPSDALGLEAQHLMPTALLEEALDGERLIIVPHRDLHLLPWAGLIWEGRRLLQDCAVGVLPNLTCLPPLAGDFAASPRAALIGAPDDLEGVGWARLVGAPAELMMLEKLYRERSELVGQPVREADATEDAFWKLYHHPESRGGILHVACHGHFDAEEPMSSGLLLADSAADAAEISRTPLAYDEVVLSACSTGFRPTAVGDVELVGDDILGLPGAFVEAGARSVLLSIPPAFDVLSRDIMGLYHTMRLDGLSPLLALQGTQLALLEQNIPPHKWVGYCCYGAT